MTERRRVSSNSPYEDVIGFSRAVRVGDTVYVSGTVAWSDDGKLVGEGDVYLQARQALRNIQRALTEAGASLRDVVRTRIYLTDLDHCTLAIPHSISRCWSCGGASSPRWP